MAMHRATFNLKTRKIMNYKKAYEILLDFQKDFPEVEKAFQKGAHKFIANLAKEVAAELKAEFPNVHRLRVHSINHRDFEVEADQDGTTWATIIVHYDGVNHWDEMRLDLTRLGGLYENFPYIVGDHHEEEYLPYGYYSKVYCSVYNVMEDLRDRINKHLKK
jgi:uncharacterized protein YktA (UPF0223 family)